MGSFAAADVVVMPVLAFGAMAAVGLHLNGFLSEELVAELRKPFSRATLLLVGGVGVMVAQLCWVASRF